MLRPYEDPSHAVAGLLTAPQATQETYGQRFRRGRETHAEQERGYSCPREKITLSSPTPPSNSAHTPPPPDTLGRAATPALLWIFQN